jgi:hypothetical protein
MENPGTAPDLRFPIGKPERPASLDGAGRDACIAQIEDLPRLVRETVAGMSESQLDTRYRPEGWTVRQVVHHLVDSHINSYVRYKLTLTEDVPLIKPYKEALWAELPEARTGDVEISLVLLEALHRRWVIMLRAMSEEEFARKFRHPEMGEMRLDTILSVYAWHGRHHVAHITGLKQRMGW